MKKTIILLICLLLAITAAACSATSSVTSDEGDGSGYSRVTGVTGSGYEYTASADQDSLTCYVEYEGASVEVNEGEFVTDDDEDEEFFVLHMTYTNDLDLVTQDSDVDDPENQDALDRSFVIKAVQGQNVIDPRDEIDAETIEEDNAYQMIDAGKSIECDYWFPVDASQPVTIQILNIDGEDTVMAELTFPVGEDD